MLGNLFSPTNSGNSGQANGGSSGLKNTSNANSSSEALSKPLSKQGRSNVDANHVITKGEAAAPTEEEKVQEE